MKIYLNDKIGIDLPKLIVSRLLAVANSGGGKSWLVRRIVEQAFGKVQIIILDPEGEYSTLREKFDFILCGKGMDAPAESRSAALLARKLLESKASAVIDLYELHPQERKRFVRLFLESMTNAPKELYNDCIIILDEAHRFAPEKEEAESLNAVIEMASLGRKRGFCLIPVTQRVSKLSKDVAAECNNKLMGRASLDLDRKRTADELGIRDRDEILALRNLEPGEFFAFGPAISNEVIRVKVGPVQTSMPKAGRQTKVAPPSARVKKELAALADLPAEAEEEARTVAELRKQLKEAKRPVVETKTEKVVDDAAIARAVKVERDRSDRLIKQYIVFIHKMLHVTGERAKAILDAVESLTKQMPEPELQVFSGGPINAKNIKPGKVAIVPPTKLNGVRPDVVILDEAGPVMSTSPSFHTNNDENMKPLSKGESAILMACAQYDGCTREQLTVLTQYKRSSRDAFIQRLQSKGYVRAGLGKINATQEGLDALGNYEPLPTGVALQEHLMRTLPEGERKMLKILIDAHPNAVERDVLSEQTGYQRSSRDAYLQRLSARELVVQEGRGMVRASDNLF